MATKTYVHSGSKGRETTWEWEETPEFLAALAQYRAVVAANKAAATEA